jgi:YbbR domain-containing protein
VIKRKKMQVQLSLKFVDVVVPVQKTKQVGINIKTKGDLNSNYILKSINPKIDKVIITGEPKDLADINKLETEPINLSILTSEKTDVKLNLVLPEGIKLVQGEQHIDTQVILDKIIQNNINLSINMKNLQEGASAKLQKDSVSIVVSGGKTILNSLTSSDIGCFVNLQDLDEGEYTVPVIIELPKGVTKISQNVQFVKVNIIKNKDVSKDNNQNNNSQQEGITNSKPVNN